MNLNEYLIENDRKIGDLVNLFSVGAVLDKVSGDTFPMMNDGDIGFDEPMNIMDMKDDMFSSQEWFDSLGFGEDTIVDEVIDNLTEQLVMKEIHKASDNKTIIMIAHRLSTVKKCDIIFFLERGELKAQGTYEELINSSEDFKKIENK